MVCKWPDDGSTFSYRVAHDPPSATWVERTLIPIKAPYSSVFLAASATVQPGASSFNLLCKRNLKTILLVVPVCLALRIFAQSPDREPEVRKRGLQRDVRFLPAEGLRLARRAMRTNPNGFSLIELLIVVAIILIIAAIAIPNFLRSRVAANQASAVESLRALSTAEFTYSSTYNAGYTATLGYLGPPSSGSLEDASHAAIIDKVLSGTAAGGATAMTSTKSGYLFTYSPGAAVNGRIVSFTINADPITRGNTGLNSYFVDQTGVVRQNSTARAGAADSPMAG